MEINKGNDDIRRIVLMLHSALKNITNVIILPTADTIKTLLAFSGGLFVVTLLSGLLGLFTFVSWQGALFNLVLVFIIFIIERGKDYELSKLYRTARVSIEKVKRRAASTSKSNSSGHSTGKSGSNKRVHGKRGTPDALQRFNSFAKKHTGK